MPIYEYRCQHCQRKFSLFWRTYSAAEEGQATCSHCGSANVRRLVSRVRVLRSEEQIADALSDPSFLSDFDEDDPKSMGRFMRRMASEFGEEAGEELGPEFEEVVDRLEAGQAPEQIEADMPDLGADLGGDDFGGDF